MVIGHELLRITKGLAFATCWPYGGGGRWGEGAFGYYSVLNTLPLIFLKTKI